MSFTTSFSLLLLFTLVCISLHSCNASRRLSDRPDDKFHISNPNEEKSVSVSAAAKVLEDQSSIKMGETDDEILKGKKESKVVSVTWRVPHNKAEDEEHPGYNLDYSPPKTHPPSHN